MIGISLVDQSRSKNGRCRHVYWKAKVEWHGTWLEGKTSGEPRQSQSGGCEMNADKQADFQPDGQTT